MVALAQDWRSNEYLRLHSVVLHSMVHRETSVDLTFDFLLFRLALVNFPDALGMRMLFLMWLMALLGSLYSLFFIEQ